jgi:hypothetical protein
MPWRKPIGSSTARGYGKQHQRARTQAAQHHHPSHPCARCGHPLGPMGPWLHLDHNDQGTGYIGFSHGRIPCPVCGRKCNLTDGAIKAAQVWEAQKRGYIKIKNKINTASRW